MKVQAKAIQAVSQLMSLNMLMWLTMLILFAALLSLAAAAYMAIAAVLAPAIAALLTGIGLLAVFALLGIVIVRVTRPPTGKSSGSSVESSTDNTAEQDNSALIGNSTTDWARDHSGTVLVGALVSGVVLAASPGLRRFAVRTAGPLIVRKLARGLQDSTK